MGLSTSIDSTDPLRRLKWDADALREASRSIWKLVAGKPCDEMTWEIWDWLVVFGHPSEKYESQLGWLETQYSWENKIDVPNHQPGEDPRHITVTSWLRDKEVK